MWRLSAPLCPHWLARALAAPIVVSGGGPADDPVAAALWRRASASTDPARSLHRLVPERLDDRGQPRDGAAIARLQFPTDRVAAYVCIGTVCSAPIADAASLARALDEATRRHSHPD